MSINMRKIFLYFIFVISFLNANNWVKHIDGMVSNSTLVIMLHEEISPKLGFEDPILLFSREYSQILYLP